MRPAPLDGNAAAGALAEIFAVDVTITVSTCTACGDTRPVAELRAWVDAPGVVLRCARCDTVLVRLVRGPSKAWLDMSGVKVLQVHLEQRG